MDDLVSNQAPMRTKHDALIERIGPTVLNRVLPLLSVSINNKPVYTWSRLKEIQKENHMPLQVEPEDEDPWDVIGRPIELTMLLRMAFSDKPKAVDWNTLQALYEGLSVSERTDLSALFEEFYEVDLNTLFSTEDALWAEPEKIQDISKLHDILGQQFVQIADTKWKRADLVVNKHKVYLVECYTDYDEEDRTSRQCTSHIQVGCAATLEGAIEVSAKILDKISAQYDVDEYGRLMRTTPDYRALQICGENGLLMLRATLKESKPNEISKTSKTALYDVQWIHPFSPSEIGQVKAQIQELNNEASQESRWDNFSTAKALRREADLLESRLPSEKFDSYAAQDTLRKTMAKIGDSRQSAALLGVDLGL